MKIFIAILLALALPCLLASQQNYAEDFALNGARKVILEFQYGDITIEKYNGSDIVVTGDLTVNGKNAVEYFEIEAQRTGSEITIKSKADFNGVERGMTIVMKDGTKIYKEGKNLTIKEVKDSDEVENVYNGIDVDAAFTIKVPSTVDLETKLTYGGVTINDYWEGMKIHSTYGPIDVILNNVTGSPNFKASSTYSEVDLTLPQSVNADLHMVTGYGQVFTDMNIDPEYKKDVKKHHHGQDITATLNKGTGSIDLSATYSNIYLRKAL